MNQDTYDNSLKEGGSIFSNIASIFTKKVVADTSKKVPVKIL